MKPILLPSNLTLSKMILNNCFEKHQPHSIFIDCNGNPALKDLGKMKFLEKANTVFLHNYPSSEITDQIISQFEDKQLVFSTLERHTPAKVIEFKLKNNLLHQKTIVSMYSSMLLAVINMNFIPTQIQVKHAKILNDYYNSIITKAELKLITLFKNQLKSA